jgi:hypothetical protein
MLPKEPISYRPPITIDRDICPVTYYGQETVLRLSATITTERFTEDPQSNPLGLAHGERTALRAIFTVPLPVYPTPSPEDESDLHDLFPDPTTTSHALGVAQAFHYPHQDINLLWSLILTQPNQPDEDPTHHPAFTAAWQALEQLLDDHFPAANVLTPATNPSFAASTWQRFLHTNGYQVVPFEEALWFKPSDEHPFA